MQVPKGKQKAHIVALRIMFQIFFSYAKHFRLVANTGNYTGGQLSSRQMEGG